MEQQSQNHNFYSLLQTAATIFMTFPRNVIGKLCKCYCNLYLTCLEPYKHQGNYHICYFQRGYLHTTEVATTLMIT